MKTYALLIGINQYHPDSMVSSLSGCVNDVKHMKYFLEERISKKQLLVEMLLNEEATYENIIKYFGKQHLLKAKKGDRVLVHYCGHGAREKAAAEFKPYFPEEKQETLVCYDSRLKGHHDLADKELAVLIGRIARKGAQVVLLLDCCHSGSGTRDASDIQLGKFRQGDDRDGERPLSTYLEGHFDKKIYIPESKHILLAACEKREKAYELVSNKGNFTTHLLKVLNQSKGNISFAGLFAQCRILMRKVSDKQTPQFETYGFFNAYSNFFDAGLDSEAPAYQAFFENGKWQVEAGAIQGLPTTPDQQAVFEIYREGELMAHAKTVSVRLNTSRISIDAELDPKSIYSARLISLPVPPIAIDLQADELGAEKVNNTLQEYHPVYFELLKDAPLAAYRLLIREDEIMIIRTADQLMIRTLSGTTEEAFKDVFKHLEHLCRWEKTLALENKKALNRKDVELVLVELDDDRNVVRKTSEPEVLIDIIIQNNRERKIPFRVEVHNHSAESWHGALFYLSENYGVYKMYNEAVQPKFTAIMMDYNPDGMPYAFELNGKNKATDIFKLIVSKEKINDYLLSQNPIKIGERISPTRGIGHEAEAFEQESFNDWFSFTMKCKTSSHS